jgi:hypothetical protein
MIAAIVDDLCVAAGRAHVPGPGEGTGAVPDDVAILRQAETGAIVSCAKSGYLQHRPPMLPLASLFYSSSIPRLVHSQDRAP